MSLNIQANASASIAVSRSSAVTDLDVSKAVVRGVAVAVIEPVLGAGVAVLEEHGGKTRDGVVKMSDTVESAGLAHDKVNEGFVTDTRGAVVEEVDGIGGAEVSYGQGSDSGT